MCRSSADKSTYLADCCCTSEPAALLHGALDKVQPSAQQLVALVPLSVRRGCCRSYLVFGQVRFRMNQAPLVEPPGGSDRQRVKRSASQGGYGHVSEGFDLCETFGFVETWPAGIRASLSPRSASTRRSRIAAGHTLRSDTFVPFTCSRYPPAFAPILWNGLSPGRSQPCKRRSTFNRTACSTDPSIGRQGANSPEAGTTASEKAALGV